MTAWVWQLPLSCSISHGQVGMAPPTPHSAQSRGGQFSTEPCTLGIPPKEDESFGHSYKMSPWFRLVPTWFSEPRSHRGWGRLTPLHTHTPKSCEPCEGCFPPTPLHAVDSGSFFFHLKPTLPLFSQRPLYSHPPRGSFVTKLILAQLPAAWSNRKSVVLTVRILT